MNTPNYPINQQGRWAVVTGASSGIGRSIAAGLAKRGYNLVLISRDLERLEALSAELASKQGVLCVCKDLDLAVHGANQWLFELVDKLHVSIFVASAGFGSAGAFLKQPIENELAMLRLNCEAVLEQVHWFARKMMEQGGGHIMLLSSVLGFMGTPWSANYAATKAYIQSLAEALSIEFKGSGVTIQSVAPGPTRSGFADRAGMLMGKAEEPDNVAADALKSLGRSGTVRPGFLAKVLGWSLATLPRFFRVRLIGLIMGGMIKT